MKFPKLPHRKDQGNIWLISDPHFYHTNICYGTSKWENKSGCRDFDTLESMNETILANINEKVKQTDFLINLGDFSFGGPGNLIDARSKIKCKNVYSLIGNHTYCLRQNEELQKLFVWVGDYLEFRYNGVLFVCCHYPIDSWNEMGTAIMCHGHCHGNFKNSQPRRFDLSVECTNYNPVHVEELLARSKECKTLTVDHHIE